MWKRISHWWWVQFPKEPLCRAIDVANEMTVKELIEASDYYKALAEYVSADKAQQGGKAGA